MSILITGGTGSFGRAFTRSALDRQLFERVCIFSRDEHKQASMREEFNDDERLRFFIGDVRDRDRLRRAMEDVETVVHAAALKRIEVGAYNPTEMVKTNVIGTMNVIEAASDAGVRRVVYLSTDKAVEPVSPYGQSKALAESIVLAANNARGSRGPLFAVTRYGNVSGSKGSVIPIWRERAANGEAVPVTDPDCTRFWMFMHEAVGLVIHTIQTMKGGELVVPILPAYRLGDLAEAMNCQTIIKGLGSYEKRHESLKPGFTSDRARRMSVTELKGALQHV